MQTLWQDLRYGARTLRGASCLMSITAMTLILGVGAVSGQEKPWPAPPLRTKTNQAQIIARRENKF